MLLLGLFLALYMFRYNHKIEGESSGSLEGKVAQNFTMGDNSSLRKTREWADFRLSCFSPTNCSPSSGPHISINQKQLLGSPWGCNCPRHLPLPQFAACNFAILAEDYLTESAFCSDFFFFPLPEMHRYVCEGYLKDPAVSIGSSLTRGTKEYYYIHIRVMTGKWV